MQRSTAQLRRDALAIWSAGVAAVRADLLVERTVQVDGPRLQIGDESLELAPIDRIAVVGAGKAGAAMAVGLERALGGDVLRAKQVRGWVNVPDGTCRPTQCIHLHPARPAGVNEPTAAAVAGTERILEIVAGLAERGLCIALISGGGSALLPAPAAGVSLSDKLAVTQFLSAAGAKIDELNAVRTCLSRVKGGGLARACRAGCLVTLIVSDVLGDPLHVIASGPTVEPRTTWADALAVLERYGVETGGVPEAVLRLLRQSPPAVSRPTARVRNLVIGNCAVAVDAAGLAAERLGYVHAATCAPASEGLAEDVAGHLAAMGRRMRVAAGPDCLVSGGEPVVKLVPAGSRGRGGRNQQLALAAGIALADQPGVLVLSGGTDGEDGPTDAAGAWADAELMGQAAALGLDPADYLRRNDAYRFFEPLGGLVRTGPTDTNVGDLRVVLVDRIEGRKPR